MDAIKLYLKDIRSLPLLTQKREGELARKVKLGDAKARQEMIKSNLRLVINIAKKYSYLGVPMLDLIEEGNLGLMKAVQKFDPERGYRFSTYAAWWIKQYITRAVANQGKTVRIPVYVMEMLMRFQKIKKQLSQSEKKNPEVTEIAKKMKLPLARVKQLNRMSSSIASLNAPIGDSGGSEFMDLIEDESITNAVDELSKFLLRERIEKLLETMTEREQKILTLRFGLTDGTTHTLRDTAQHFGITRERVRQIEAACMVKMRKMMEDQEQEAEDRLLNSKGKDISAEAERIVKRIKKVAKSQKKETDEEKNPLDRRMKKTDRRKGDNRRQTTAGDRRKLKTERRTLKVKSRKTKVKLTAKTPKTKKTKPTVKPSTKKLKRKSKQ
ncbi:MAG: sigma-70 family RNA polymerase sigma factor [Candidatus Omnitrophica bacterium]|nr:sigma-70 family RNA polymerase sigma factor [Candidatus Omnitrophota bacterium]